jgi:RimJ/RimL family protein N-acetyltransferase
MQSKNGFLKGRLVEFVPVSAEHYNLYVQWENNAEVRKYSRNIFPTTVELMKKSVEEAKENPAPPEVIFEIQYLENHQPIGFAVLHHIFWVDRFAKIGLTIGETEYWNKGVGADANRLLLKYGFEELNLNKIVAQIFSPNVGSLACAKKCNMILEATLKEECFVQGKYVDVFVYRMLAKEWFSQNQNVIQN